MHIKPQNFTKNTMYRTCISIVSQNNFKIYNVYFFIMIFSTMSALSIVCSTSIFNEVHHYLNMFNSPSLVLCTFSVPLLQMVTLVVCLWLSASQTQMSALPGCRLCILTACHQPNLYFATYQQKTSQYFILYSGLNVYND